MSKVMVTKKATREGILVGDKAKVKYKIKGDDLELVETKTLWVGMYKDKSPQAALPVARISFPSGVFEFDTKGLGAGKYMFCLRSGEVWPLIKTHAESDVFVLKTVAVVEESGHSTEVSVEFITVGANDSKDEEFWNKMKERTSQLQKRVVENGVKYETNETLSMEDDLYDLDVEQTGERNAERTKIPPRPPRSESLAGNSLVVQKRGKKEVKKEDEKRRSEWESRFSTSNERIKQLDVKIGRRSSPRSSPRSNSPRTTNEDNTKQTRIVETRNSPRGRFSTGGAKRRSSVKKKDGIMGRRQSSPLHVQTIPGKKLERSLSSPSNVQILHQKPSRFRHSTPNVPGSEAGKKKKLESRKPKKRPKEVLGKKRSIGAKGQLRAPKGTMLTVISELKGGWYLCVDQAARTGLVPIVYCTQMRKV